jgi:hypothetical protein
MCLSGGIHVAAAATNASGPLSLTTIVTNTLFSFQIAVFHQRVLRHPPLLAQNGEQQPVPAIKTDG